MTMPSRFRPLSARVGAQATMRPEEMLDPAFGAECLEALERFGVLVFPQIGLTDEQQVMFSSHLGELMPQGMPRATVAGISYSRSHWIRRKTKPPSTSREPYIGILMEPRTMFPRVQLCSPGADSPQ
jgi:alpha-ketoglutarate-dependent taurine dioxygenase